jgi:pimeloyl-ACP methyl ester carboxylesterase
MANKTLLAVVLMCLMATALTTPIATRAQTPPPQPDDDPTTETLKLDEAERSAPRRLQFASCPENAAVECGMLTLPVDYNNPHSETFEMAIIRAKVSDPANRIGIVVLNPGGPASSGVDFVLDGIGVPAFDGLRSRFDVISFDVRGSQRSRAVKCDAPQAGDPTGLDDEQLAALIDDFSRKFAQACIEQNGPFILSMSTNNIARDMDMLRRALREPQLTYYGMSYGTVLGSVYASLFSKRVRGMILDAGAPPNFRDSLVEFASEQAISFEQTLHRLDQLCRKAPTCRLRETGVATAMDAVLAKLTQVPVAGPNGEVLDVKKLRGIVTTLLSIETSWPLIVQALADAQSGDYTRLFQLIPAIGTVSLSNTAFFAIKCNDSGTRRSAAEYLPTSKAVGELTPRLHDRFFVANIVATCAAWPPADVPVIRNVSRRLTTPILLLGNDFDPNTPLSWTRKLAFALGMDRNIVRYRGGGHTIATRGTACIGGVVFGYFLNLSLPAEGASCPGRSLVL